MRLLLTGIDGKSSSQGLLDRNLAGTIHLLEHCRRHDAGFILHSTSRYDSLGASTNNESHAI